MSRKKLILGITKTRQFRKMEDKYNENQGYQKKKKKIKQRYNKIKFV